MGVDGMMKLMFAVISEGSTRQLLACSPLQCNYSTRMFNAASITNRQKLIPAFGVAKCIRNGHPWTFYFDPSSCSIAQSLHLSALLLHQSLVFVRILWRRRRFVEAVGLKCVELRRVCDCVTGMLLLTSSSMQWPTWIPRFFVKSWHAAVSLWNSIALGLLSSGWHGICQTEAICLCYGNVWDCTWMRSMGDFNSFRPGFQYSDTDDKRRCYFMLSKIYSLQPHSTRKSLAFPPLDATLRYSNILSCHLSIAHQTLLHCFPWDHHRLSVQIVHLSFLRRIFWIWKLHSRLLQFFQGSAAVFHFGILLLLMLNERTGTMRWHVAPSLHSTSVPSWNFRESTPICRWMKSQKEWNWWMHTLLVLSCRIWYESWCDARDLTLTRQIRMELEAVWGFPSRTTPSRSTPNHYSHRIPVKASKQRKSWVRDFLKYPPSINN